MQTNEYLKLAEVEDQMWYFRSLHEHVRRELARFALAPGAHILDAGCGTGGLILRLLRWRPDWRYSAIDFSPVACGIARRRCGDAVDVREASIEALPFPDETFDAILPVDVISQVERPARAFAEFYRVLRPGGVLILNTPAYRWMWSYHDETCETKHRYTRPEIQTLLTTTGFEPRALTHWNALPFPALFAKRKIFRSARDTSDVKEYPAAVEAVLNGLMRVEHAWLQLGGSWAWGTSILASATKPPRLATVSRRDRPASVRDSGFRPIAEHG